MNPFLVFILISWIANYTMVLGAQTIQGGMLEPNVAYYIILFFTNWRIYIAVLKHYEKKESDDV